MCITLLDDAAWRDEDDSSSSFSFSSSAPAAAPVAAELPPVLLLVVYSLEFAHAVSSGALPRSIQQALAARHAAADPAQSRQFVVALAQVDTEQASKPASATAVAGAPRSGTCAPTKCGAAGCSQPSAGATTAAAASSSSASACCSSPSSSCAACAPVVAPSVVPASLATAITPSRGSPLVFSSCSATGLVDASTTPLSTFELNGFHFALPTALLSAPAGAEDPVAAATEAFNRIEVLWVGSDASDRLLVNCMLNFNAHAFGLLDPLSYRLRRHVKTQSRTLARRYYLMEKAKNAEIVGILVGTLGVASYLQVIRQLQGLLRGAGKKAYVFVVGKLNEPKLSNFAEVDLFVLVACPLNTMFDSTGYYRDVVTPFELDMAIRGTPWKGTYATAFDKILPPTPSSAQTAAAVDAEADGSATSSSSAVAASAAPAVVSQSEWLNDDLESGVRFDPITGKMRQALPSHLAAKGITLADQEGAGGAGALLATGSAGGGAADQQLTRIEGGHLVHFKTASEHFLAQRSFHGLLLQHEGEVGDEIAPIEQGLSGIARSYTTSTLQPADKQLPQPVASKPAEKN